MLTFHSVILVAGARSRSVEKRSGAPRGLGTVPETYESDIEQPRSGAPKPNPETKKLQQQLARADNEIDRLQQVRCRNLKKCCEKKCHF